MKTSDFLLDYVARYPLCQPQDAYKLLYQSAFGCEHLLKDEAGAVGMIAREAASGSTEMRWTYQPMASASSLRLAHILANVRVSAESSDGGS